MNIICLGKSHTSGTIEPGAWKLPGLQGDWVAAAHLWCTSVSWMWCLTPGPIFPSFCTGWVLAHTWVLFRSKPAHSNWVRIWVHGVHSKGTDGPCQLWLFPLRAALQNYPAKLVLLNNPCTIPITAHIFCALL